MSLPAFHQERAIDREVTVRTRDDVAVLQDLPRGRNQVAHGFPVTPAFDALSYFSLQWSADRHMTLTSSVSDVQPLTYDMTVPNKADVVVMGLRYYKADFAPDSSDAPNGRTHLLLHPFAFVTRTAPRNALYFSELFIDNATGLPASVDFSGPDDMRFAVDYAMNGGYWLIDHAHYEQTLHGPLRIGMLHVVADATYDSFSFPAAPPDPRLAPTTAASPAIPAPLATPAPVRNPPA